MRARATLVVLFLAAALAFPARAQEKKGDEAKAEPKKDEPKKDDKKPDEPKKDEPKKDEPKKDDKKPDEPKKDEPKKDLLALPEDVAKAIARFDELKAPKREAARLVCTLTHALLRRDAEGLGLHFHKDLRLHTGHGELEPIPLEKMKESLRSLGERPETKLTVPELLDLETLKVYTKDECKNGEGKALWKKDPTPVADVMEKDDLVVLVKTKARTWSGKAGDELAFEAEIFYVVRRDGERLKVTISE